MECLIPHKHTLKILYKSNHFPPRYKRKREWVIFSEHSVLCAKIAPCMRRTNREEDFCIEEGALHVS